MMWQVSQAKEVNCPKINSIHPGLTHLLENTFVEELLQFLIAVIDTELLKAVMLKIL